MIRDSWVAFLAALAIALGAGSCAVGDAGDEETVEMISGSYRTVAEGRAEILVGGIGEVWNEDLGLMVDAIEVDVSCGEDRQVVWVSEEQPTEPVCRIQLQLVKITNWAPAKARLRVTWIP
jgi:hypothetical protein